MSKFYKKKPVIIEAVKWNGTEESLNELYAFAGKVIRGHDFPQNNSIYINTLEGTMKAKCGDYIIKGVDGEFYPCKPHIFENTYEEVCK